MNILLDTHAVIWYSLAADKMTEKALNALDDTGNTVSLSQVSIWEMQIKKGLGKLSLPSSVKELVEQQLVFNDFQLINIRNPHLWHLDTLPDLHRDPFDRLLVSQAQYEECVLLTADSKIPKYDVETLW